MQEPLHETRADAVSWVENNTDNVLFRSTLDATIVRVDARGTVMILRQQVDGEQVWFWESLRSMF